VASQEGKYLAKLFNSHTLAAVPRPPPALAAAYGNPHDKNIGLDVWVPMPADAAPFK
jgi:hypothetical protein